MIAGVDGEGQGRSPHRYTFLAASDEEGGRRWSIANPAGLSSSDCLDFLISLPLDIKTFAFSFLYDLAKMLQDLPNELLYKLVRPEMRLDPKHHRPKWVKWGKYRLNFLRTKFVIKRGKRVRTLWDVFPFFQSKFTLALDRWKIGTDEELDYLARMKEQRAEFDKLDDNDVQEYCFDECSKLARLVRKLITAHDEAGLTLRNFYGAGSTASVILDKFEIKTKRGETPIAMAVPIARAFFGGRFENSRIGVVTGPIYGYDIASAYPYQTVFLPCLQCGLWRKTRDIESAIKAKAALIQYCYSGQLPDHVPWAPLPHRGTDGTICYPRYHAGGWVWRDEFLAACKVYPHLEFIQAWVLESDCDHQPFKEVPSYYRERVKLGKDAAGIVIKLGLNSLYGKLAQSLGRNPPYQSWVWAGLITSGTRAQILEALALCHNRASLLAVATDGIYSTERLNLTSPRDTGTSDLSKPLGCWEEKILERGLFLARPGVYFQLDPTEEDLQDLRARGIGKRALMTYWKGIVNAWETGQETYKVATVTRFCGIKTSISRRGENEYHRADYYGEWVNRPIELTFNPYPKRKGSGGSSLLVRDDIDTASEPYTRVLSPEAIALKLLDLEAQEQPDGGELSEYEFAT